jgi:hypothetical protein
VSRRPSGCGIDGYGQTPLVHRYPARAGETIER